MRHEVHSLLTVAIFPDTHTKFPVQLSPYASRELP